MLKKNESGGGGKRCICKASRKNEAPTSCWGKTGRTDKNQRFQPYFSVNYGKSLSFGSRRGRFPFIWYFSNAILVYFRCTPYQGHRNKNAIFTHVITNLSAWKGDRKWEASCYRPAAFTLANNKLREFRAESFSPHLCSTFKNFCRGWVISLGRVFDLDFNALGGANPPIPWGNSFNA